MKNAALAFFLFLMVTACATMVYAWPSPGKFDTGVTVYDNARTYEGYTLYAHLFTPGAAVERWDTNATAFLIDMEGNEVHTWRLPWPALNVELLPNGNLLCMGNFRGDDGEPGDRPGLGQYAGIEGNTGFLYELKWDGTENDANIVFEYYDRNMHHDFEKLPNGNYIYLGWEPLKKRKVRKVRGGMKGTEFEDGTMFVDYIREITPSGETVWEWHGADHLKVKKDIIGPIWPRNEWTHFNSIDVLEDGNILVTSRRLDSMLLIDKATKKIIWRWGNVAYLDRNENDEKVIEFKNVGSRTLNPPPTTLSAPHCCNEIPSGFSGGGNFLCYDNGVYRGVSRAVEVNPHTNEVVWQSLPTQGIVPIFRTHYSSVLSGTSRLPNGNTLICAGVNGRIFEVTDGGDLVWEWINPSQFPGIFRARRYGPDYCDQLSALP